MSRVMLSRGAVAYPYAGTVEKVGWFTIAVKGEPGNKDLKLGFGDFMTPDFSRLARNAVHVGDHVKGTYRKASRDRPYYMGEDDVFMLSSPHVR